jgi:hypothetical protein
MQKKIFRPAGGKSFFSFFSLMNISIFSPPKQTEQSTTVKIKIKQILKGMKKV